VRASAANITSPTTRGLSSTRFISPRDLPSQPAELETVRGSTRGDRPSRGRRIISTHRLRRSARDLAELWSEVALRARSDAPRVRALLCASFSDSPLRSQRAIPGSRRSRTTPTHANTLADAIRIIDLNYGQGSASMSSPRRFISRDTASASSFSRSWENPSDSIWHVRLEQPKRSLSRRRSRSQRSPDHPSAIRRTSPPASRVHRSHAAGVPSASSELNDPRSLHRSQWTRQRPTQVLGWAVCDGLVKSVSRPLPYEENHPCGRPQPSTWVAMASARAQLCFTPTVERCARD